MESNIDAKRIDELLELIWTIGETNPGVKTDDLIRDSDDPEAQACIELMRVSGLLQIRAGTVLLTETGHARAQRIIRRHRLAERLLHDILETDDKEIESQACEFEHILSKGVAESICTLLGHPPTCPHGKPIPRGDCCKRDERAPYAVILPLSELQVGEQARIMFIRAAERSELRHLTELGILPGRQIRVHQTLPLLVIQVSDTNLALDRGVAEQIYVKPWNGHCRGHERGRRRRLRLGWRHRRGEHWGNDGNA